MMHTKRRYFTLLEALIAALLAITVLTAVSYFYHEIDYINTKTALLQKESFEQRYAEGRLASTLTRAVPERDPKKDFFFMTVNDPGGLFHKDGTTSLLFVYDNLVDLNHSLSNHVLGRLYLDPHGNLSLATWPSPKRWESSDSPPIKNEILLTNVDSLKFQFFIPPERNWKLQAQQTAKPQVDDKKDESAAKQVKVVVKPSPEGSWISEWRPEYNMLPGMVRVELQRKGETIRYAFPLTETSRQIVYTQ